MKTCPKCGGDEGYEVSQVIRHIETNTWEECENHTISVDSELLTVGKTAKCSECGARFGIEKYGLKGM